MNFFFFPRVIPPVPLLMSRNTISKWFEVLRLLTVLKNYVPQNIL